MLFERGHNLAPVGCCVLLSPSGNVVQTKGQSYVRYTAYVAYFAVLTGFSAVQTAIEQLFCLFMTGTVQSVESLP